MLTWLTLNHHDCLLQNAHIKKETHMLSLGHRAIPLPLNLGCYDNGASKTPLTGQLYSLWETELGEQKWSAFVTKAR